MDQYELIRTSQRVYKKSIRQIAKAASERFANHYGQLVAPLSDAKGARQ